MAGCGQRCRCFFALWPDAAVAEGLHRIAVDAHRSSGGRLMRLDTLHLTLAFLGDIPGGRVLEARRVADAVAVAPFDLMLDRLGYWRHNRILWAGGAVPPRLTLVANALGDGLSDAGFTLDARPFAPHVTLLRDAQCATIPSLSEAITWPVREFLLAASRPTAGGARYEIIGRWSLGGGTIATD